MKSKGEKERYKHLNAEVQRIARRDKKALLSGHCKEIEENNRRGKTRDLFKIIRDTKATFHAKIDTIKDRNGMDLTEAEDTKKLLLLLLLLQSCLTLCDTIDGSPPGSPVPGILQARTLKWIAIFFSNA